MNKNNKIILSLPLPYAGDVRKRNTAINTTTYGLTRSYHTEPFTWLYRGQKKDRLCDDLPAVAAHHTAYHGYHTVAYHREETKGNLLNHKVFLQGACNCFADIVLMFEDEEVP